MKRVHILMLAALTAFASNAAGQGDPEVIAKIIDEGKNRNQVMQHLEYLTQQIGPRLTGSPRLQQACEWTRSTFESFGLTNCTLEQWSTIPVGFQRGARQVARMISPVVREFEFTTRAWSAGTKGPVRGRAVMEPQTMEALQLMKGILRGAWVISKPAVRRRRGQEESQERVAIASALRDIGIAGRVIPSRSDLVHTSGSWRNLSFDDLPTDVSVIIRKSDRDAIIEQVASGEEVVLEFDIENIFLPGPVPVYNVIAEIRGAEKPDEVVIVSGHLDSWNGPGSQGTCDNGTGTMVALEAARILMAAGAKPKRTIRFIMWTGEEQGLLGSRAYVQKHKDELKNISAVFVDDGGTNYSGGLVCIEAMAPMLRSATEAVSKAFPNMPVNIRVVQRMPRGGGSDHAPFNGAGVPGFFWSETGRANYGYIHHTQHDSFDQAIPEYLVQSSVAAAVTAYNLACAETLLPRQQAEEPPKAA